MMEGDRKLEHPVSKNKGHLDDLSVCSSTASVYRDYRGVLVAYGILLIFLELARKILFLVSLFKLRPTTYFLGRSFWASSSGVVLKNEVGEREVGERRKLK